MTIEETGTREKRNSNIRKPADSPNQIKKAPSDD